MAPEQWQGASVEASLEIWALGIVLFEMLEGHRPFDDGMALLSKIGAGTKVVVISAHGSERHAVEAMKAGAYDYFRKPLDLENTIESWSPSPRTASWTSRCSPEARRDHRPLPPAR